MFGTITYLFTLTDFFKERIYLRIVDIKIQQLTFFPSHFLEFTKLAKEKIKSSGIE